MKYFCDDFLNIMLNTLIKVRIGKILIYCDILIIILDYNIASWQGPESLKTSWAVCIKI
jgi:hypothetical protein